MKILTVVGARPQFVKAGVVSRAMRSKPEFSEIILHTGQHYDDNMSAIFFDELDIPRPAFNVGVGSGLHGEQTGRMLSAIESVIQERHPDWVLIYGDTNSTLAGALAAAKLHVPVAHVEAGLRSFNRLMPEEINRVVADHLSNLLFAPTITAVKNLAREGISGNHVQNVGDVMYDAARYYGAKAQQKDGILKSYRLEPRGYVLATVHRAENTDDEQRLRNIMTALSQVSEQVPVVFPVHPRTRKILHQLEIRPSGQVHLLDPVGYLDMVGLEMNARVVATDSGGIQKEAYFFHVPCVTLRTETEWVELVELGWNQIVPPSDSERITDALLAAAAPSMAEQASPYGDGHSAEKICDILLSSTVLA